MRHLGEGFTHATGLQGLGGIFWKALCNLGDAFGIDCGGMTGFLPCATVLAQCFTLGPGGIHATDEVLHGWNFPL